MRFYKTLLKKIQLSRLILISLIIVSCQEEKLAPKNYAAKVGNEYLLESEVQQFVNLQYGNAALKDEFIRNWIRKQILLQSALAEGLAEDNNYYSLVAKAKNDILINLFIEEFTDKLDKDIDEDSLMQFYSEYNNKFVLGSDLFLMNIAQFKNEFEAEEFLNFPDGSWSKRVEILINSGVAAEENKDVLLYEYELPSKNFYDGIKYLNANEYSGVISSGYNGYTVVQLINKYDKGSLADFSIIKKMVRTTYIASKKQEMINKLVESLYDDFEIEIK